MTPAPVPIPITNTPPPTGVKMSDVYLRRFYEALATVRCEIRFITPTWAKEQLERNNTRNRRLSAVWQKIRAAIFRDAWWPNGEAIVFDSNGRLINGQHRLKAISESEMAVPCFVFYGINPEAFSTYDQGKKRNSADVLSIEGYAHTSHLATALGWQMVYDAGDIDKAGHRTVPNDRAVELAKEYPKLAESVAWACAHQNKLIPPGLLTFLHCQFLMKDANLTAQFFERVIEAVGVVKPSWEYGLRRRLEELIGVRDDNTQIEIAALIIKCWNRLRQNAPPTASCVSVWKENEPFPPIV